jgi:hypothetical protein
MPKIAQLIYSSVLSPSTKISEVSAIIRNSRARNFSSGITGVLLFDGQRFCQCIEGQTDQVSQLSENIKKDKRNIDFKVIYLNTAEDTRKFSNWRAGYPMENTLSVMSDVIDAPQDKVLDVFMRMTNSFDLV